MCETENNKVNFAKNLYVLVSHESFADYGYNLFYNFGQCRYETLGGDNTKYAVISYGNIGGREKILLELRKYHKLESAITFSPVDIEKTGNVNDGRAINNPVN